MTAVAVSELLAWLLSAVIGAWLLVDMVRVSRRYGDQTLINREDLAEGAISSSTAVDDPKGDTP